MDIYKRMSHRLTEYLIDNEAMEKDKQDIYDYGLELLFSSIVNFLLIFIIGVVFNRLLETLVFLIAFCPIRQFGGGYHASNHLNCAVLFNVSYIVIILFEKHIWKVNPLTAIIASLVAVVVIFLLAPIEDANKPLSQRQVKLFRKTTRIIATAYLVCIIAGVSMFPQVIHYIAYIVMALVEVSLLITIGYFKNRKGI